ncbi:MAG: PPC domain-containing protein [Pirellulaceae bacterium]
MLETRFRMLALLVMLPCSSVLLAEPPTVDYLFPAGGQQGETVEVTASGAFSNWPAMVWTDRLGVEFQPQKEKGKLKAAIAADAQPGVYWLRLVDAEGASSLRPFVVGMLAEVSEKEPNDDPDAPQSLAQSATVNGRLEKRGDVDTYAIELKEGQTLVASMRANTQLGSPVDAVLQFCTEDGFVLLQNDDERGFDPLLIVSAPRDGVFLVRTFGFPATPNSTIGFAGAENYVYRLTITNGAFVDHTLPLAAARGKETTLRLAGWNLPKEIAELTLPADAENSEAIVSHGALANSLPLVQTSHPLLIADDKATPAEPQAIELPCVVSGAIRQRRQAHAFAFDAAKGQKLSFQIESRSLGYPLDPLLIMTDETGKIYSEVDDTGRESRDATLNFTAPADGRFILVVRDLHDRGGPRFAYRLTCEEQTPDFNLTLAGGEFTLAAGKTLEIPVTVERLLGLKDEITVVAESLPEGVAAEAVVSQGSGDTSKSVKLKLTAAADAKPASGVLRIVGRAGDTQKPASFSLADMGVSQTAAWLTVTTAK